MREEWMRELHIIFSSGPPGPEQLDALERLMSSTMAWNIPYVAAATFLAGEIIRTYPGEVRLISRVIKRRKPNLAEMLFILIKYFSLIFLVLFVLINFTSIPKSDWECRTWSWTFSTLLFLGSWLVFVAIAWRTLIIFRNSKAVKLVLCIGLLIQFGVSMAANWRVYKATTYDTAGYCTNPAADARHFWATLTFWFLVWSASFDLCMVIAGCYRLWHTARGPQGFARISKLLFTNNVHYAIILELLNLTEIILIMGWQDQMPPLHYLSLSIQLCLGMQLLISEQEAAHSRSHPTLISGSHYDSSPKSAGGNTTLISTSGNNISSQNVIKFEEETVTLEEKQNTYDKYHSHLDDRTAPSTPASQPKGIGAIRAGMNRPSDRPGDR